MSLKPTGAEDKSSKIISEKVTKNSTSKIQSTQVKWYYLATRLRNISPKNRGLLIWNVLYAIAGLSFIKFGQYSSTILDEMQGPGSWKTWDFLGNSGRSPMFMYRVRPWVDDIEGRLRYDDEYRTQLQEFCTTYRLF